LECITDAKEKKTKRSVVVATEDVINVETDVIERIQMIEQICMFIFVLHVVERGISS